MIMRYGLDVSICEGDDTLGVDLTPNLLTGLSSATIAKHQACALDDAILRYLKSQSCLWTTHDTLATNLVQYSTAIQDRMGVGQDSRRDSRIQLQSLCVCRCDLPVYTLIAQSRCHSAGGPD